MASFPVWTRDDDKRFELALAYFMDSPPCLENIAKYLQKPLEEVTYYYNALLHDVELIHSGKVALPHYPEDDYVPLTEASTPKKTKGNPWTQEEHRLFLEGVKKYGRSNWKMISREFVKTRTGIQVASHAQKYYLRQELGVKNGKRQSIHEYITLESTMGKLDFGKQNPPDDDGSQGSCFGV